MILNSACREPQTEWYTIMSIDPQEAHPWISVMYDVGVAIDDYFTTADFATSEAEDIQTTRVIPGDVKNTIG